MKSFLILIITVLQSLCLCSCSSPPPSSSDNITPTDLQETTDCWQVLCAKDKTATIVKSNFPNNSYSYELKQANEKYDVFLTCSEDIGIIVSDSDQREIQQIDVEFQTDCAENPIQFIDFNQDGYADIWINLGGTLNSCSIVYLWDSDAYAFEQVLYDGFLSYFEVHENYIQNWIKESAQTVIVQTLIWCDSHTLKLESEVIFDVETGEILP